MWPLKCPRDSGIPIYSRGAWLLLLWPPQTGKEGDGRCYEREAAPRMPPCKPLGTTVGHTGDVMGVGASSPDPPQIPPEMGRKKRGVAPLLTLRKRLARRRWRASKGFDHAQVFNDFLNSAGWTVREVAALVHEYEATAALRELTAQADAARPPARSCRADLGRLLESRLCADVTLAYRGTAFPAHRALLSARCPFFRDLLSEAGGGPRQQMMVVEMDIPGVGVELFGDLLRYLYTGELSVAGEAGSSAALSTLLRLSEQFGVPNPLAHDLRRMLEGGHLADTSLVWEVPGSGGGTEQEAEFPCHRAVLAARCPFFRGVIQRRTTTASGSGAVCDVGGTTPGCRMRVVLDAGVVPVRHARVLLWALYQDTVDLSMLPCSSGGSLADEFMELYQVARLIEVDSLAQACEDALVELLGPDTLCGVLQWSEQPHGSPWVHRQAMAFLAEEFSALAVTPLLFQLTKGQLLTLLQSDCLQASELEILVAVLKWGEQQLLKRMEEREPNIVSQTAHSVARRGARSRRDLLSDGELRDLLSELLCHVRTAHVLPPAADALLSAQRRGLFPRPPPCMLGGEEAPPSRGAASWLAGPRPRLFAPYVEEAKAWLEDQLSQEQALGPVSPSPWPPHLSHIPDTLYMVDKGAAGGFREACPCVPHGVAPVPAVRLPDPSLPVLSEELLRQMRQREQELRQGAARAYSLGANRCAISHQLQLRVVREAGLPDQAATLLAQAPPPNEDWTPASMTQDPLDLMVARPATSARAPPNPILVPPSRAPPRRLAPPSDLRLHRQPHLGRRALRLAELQSENSNLSKMIPDIAMATATLEHLDLAESDKDNYGCEADDLSPVHMLV
ncbi:BTB/POZ domain-containing protein 7 isoform X2 [Dermacentor albipictus]